MFDMLVIIVDLTCSASLENDVTTCDGQTDKLEGLLEFCYSQLKIKIYTYYNIKCKNDLEIL